VAREATTRIARRGSHSWPGDRIPPRAALFACALILAVVSILLWMGVRWIIPEGGSMLKLPLGSSRELHVSMWSREKRFITEEYFHSDFFIVDGPVVVNVWTYDRRMVRMQRLATVRLPAWPLLVMAAGWAGVAAWLRPRRDDEP
jgi:hypothetical protein